MNQKTLHKTVEEARAFLEQADVVLKSCNASGYFLCSPRETGSLRRRSMELTRSLSTLRRHD